MARKDFNNSNRLWILLSTLVCCLLSSRPVSAGNNDSFTVSVYQSQMSAVQPFKITREAALAHMNKHMITYESVAEEAATTKSQILVFPEYCLYADIPNFGRNNIVSFLEPIPDPKVYFSWTPCDIKNSTEDITIQKKFSCMAKKNKLYIVANVGEIETCNKTLDNRCPRDGRYQFNTNVVYAPNGTLISRYRKKHLFGEPYFNSPPVAEHGVFDTPFGRFATIVCFDIFFSDTFQDLIVNKGVRNIIFPNMWFSIPPLFFSVPFHTSIAWATNINLISADVIVDKTFRIGGSGFYNGMSGNFSYFYSPGLLTQNMTNIKSDPSFRFAEVSKHKTPGPGNLTVNTYRVGDVYSKSIRLVDAKGSIGVCHYDFCCGLEYELELEPSVSVWYALLATKNFEYEACSVCPVIKGKMMCEGFPVEKNLHFNRFKSLKLFANEFETEFVFPQVILMTDKSNQVPNPSSYYSDGVISLSNTPPLHSVVLLDRVYPPKTSGSSHPTISFSFLVGLLLLCLL